MLAAAYFAFGMLVVTFLIALYKLWRAHRRMVVRDRVMTTRMMETTGSHRKTAKEESAVTRELAQGSLWKD